MTTLLTGDVHFTNNPRDDYRWGLLPWLAEQVRHHKADNVIIAGDLTDTKDRHPSSLVNKMVDGLADIAKAAYVVVLKGNHDYVNPVQPYFGFARHLPGVSFISEPSVLDLRVAGKEVPCLFLPSAVDPKEEWPAYKSTLCDFGYVFCHQTFTGAQRENGTLSEDGIGADFFKGFKGQVFSGDIHVQQRFKNPYGPEYIGSPYRIDFGDRFTPRVLLIDSAGKKTDLHFPCPMKHLIEIGADGEVHESTGQTPKPGDQVKVRVTLKRSDYPLWPKLRANMQEMAREGGWELYGPELRAAKEDAVVPPKYVGVAARTPEEIVCGYAEVMLGTVEDPLVDIGIEIVKGVA